MPVAEYGVWKAKPVSYTYETEFDDPVNPHLSLIFTDDKPGQGQAAINIKSGDTKESRLVCWLSQPFQNPITNELKKLHGGFRLLEGTDEQGPGGLALDYIRENRIQETLFQKETGRLLPHDIPGEDNDILDILKPILNRAISNKATIYLYGSHFDNGKGIHDVHMNQGNPKRFARDNGVFQDGGFVLQFSDHWEAVFIGFASQAIRTEDGPVNPGFPIPRKNYTTWRDFLELETPDREKNESPVVISGALVNPPGPDNQPEGNPETVSLTNRTEEVVDLSGWKIRNKVGQFEELSSGDTLSANGSEAFKVPGCPLSNQGGIIMLFDKQGRKMHGVSYTRAQLMQGEFTPNTPRVPLISRTVHRPVHRPI
ncbi:hypothetical protein V500_02200 [Pseudogymnoascus sp. VKM F-4518 (FW-2643)]|nr:hypothetical protein V500_02200 [Pseudogymnoascus sp. VKM F-4518 (FW-2643)]